MINNFLNELFNEDVSPNLVVKKYIKYSTNKNDGGIIGYDLAVKHIELTRREITEDNGWMVPNYKVARLKNRIIKTYKDYKKLDTLNLSFNKQSAKSQIYVLLNKNRDIILQYFWIKDKKIASFSLFVKPKKAYFFTYE